MLFRYFIKAILSNRRIWVLGVLQLLVWLFMIAFIFAGNATGTYDEILPAISIWYGYIALASFSTLSVVLAATVLYSNSSLAYCFRFTELSPSTYMINLLGGCSIIGGILSIIHMFACYVIFSLKFHLNLAPINPFAAILVSILAGAFMMVFGIALALSAVNYTGLQSAAISNFIPIMLTIVFGMSQIFTPLPYLVVLLSPFNEIESLLYQGYSNQIPHVHLMNTATRTVQWQLLVVLLFIWIILLLLIDIYQLKHLKPRNVEEARPF